MVFQDILDKKLLPLFLLAIASLVGLGAVLYKRLPAKFIHGTPAATGSSSAGFSAKQKANMEELKALELHLQNKPGHPPILFRMAQIAHENGKSAEAAKLLREILQQEPENADARLELGRVLYETGDVAGAIEQTRQILNKNPKHPDALYNLGAIYANINNTALARDYWTRAVASAPHSESGQNAQRGLQQLGERPAAFDPNLRLPKPDQFR